MYSIKEINNKNPLLNQVIIKNEALHFHGVIYPNLGASLQKLTSNGVEIIDGITTDEDGLNTYKSKYNSSFLFPFPSRIPKGKYTFNNTDYELDCNETALNNSLHGHIHNKSFILKQKEITNDKAVVTLSYSDKGATKGFPFSYELDITYIFTKGKLTVGFTVYNNGVSEFPFGIGWHPYFKTDNLSESILDFDAEKQYLLNKKMIPEREIPLEYNTPLLIKDTFLDDCFIIKKPVTSFKTTKYNINLNFSSKSANSFLQVYTPPLRDGIAIEPMTCIGNSFNNKIGLQVLQPNNRYNWTVALAYSSN